jgi:hypothetical protein
MFQGASSFRLALGPQNLGPALGMVHFKKATIGNVFSGMIL